MPQLPTYTATGNTRAGPVAAPIDASVLDRPARALQGLGASIANTGAEVGQIVEQRKKEDELRWATETTAQYSRVLAERRAEDARNPRETEGIEFRDFADQTLADYTKAAPSRRAADMFRAKGLGLANDGYEKALHSGEITRLLNADASNEKATADIVSTYKTTSSLDNPVGAAQDIAPLVQSQLASIETRFGQTMPLKAERMRNHLVSEVALGTGATNPAYAHQLVNSAPIDEKLKIGLNNEIDRLADNANEEAKIFFSNGIHEELKTAATTHTLVDPRPKSDFNILGKGRDAAYAQYKLATQFNNEVVGNWNKIKEQNPYYQRQYTAALRQSGHPSIAEELDKGIDNNVNDIKSGNVVGYLTKNNEQIAMFFKPNPGATPEEQIANTRMGYEFIKHYSGAPPRDPNGNLLVSEAESKKFLGLSTGQQHLLTTESANSLAGELNGLGPQDLYMRVKQFPALYGNEINSAMVFNDLVTLPKEGNKLSPATQFALAMPTPELAIKYLGTVKAAKEVKVPSGTTQKDFFDELKNTNWPLFRRAFNGDNEQRRGQINDFEDAVLHYAYSLADTKNPNPKSAVRTAVDHLVDQSFGFPMVNGVPVAVLRERGPGKPNRTDEDMAEIGRTLAVSFRQFPLQQLSITDPLSRAVFPKAEFINDPVEKMQYISDAIASRGFWMVESHGQSATVYVADESGKATVSQLRDKTGQPFEVAFDDLPKYETPGISTIETRGTVQQIPTTIKEQPKSSYPIAEKQHEFTPMERANLYYLFGAPTLIPGLLPKTTVRTNWPVAGPQYKRQVP